MYEMIYIVGRNSFIAKHLYLALKKKYQEIILLSHNEIDQLETKLITGDDIVINCCGVNRASSKEEYYEGNYQFISNLCKYLSKDQPYLIHISSLMVYGFKDIPIGDMSDYQRWFIESKLKGDNYLLSTYDKDRLCIIRPSNVYGYDCKPYYNNLLTTMVYEKIRGLAKINRLNKNCIRNMISINGLVNKIAEYIEGRRNGVYNIISSNSLSLDRIIISLYNDNNNDLPDYIEITDDTPSVFTVSNEIGETIIIEEDFDVEIKKLEKDIRSYYNLLDRVKIKDLNYLQQSRGDMVEITPLESKRLYKITINQNAVRGNHYHYKQIEDFYINRGKVLFLLALDQTPDIIHVFTAKKDQLITINPLVIHTVCNEFLNNIPEIIISSTQEFIPNEIPDTKYVNLV